MNILQPCISPFQNESEVVTVQNTLTIENRLDRVQIYGELDITMDKRGLEAAIALKRQIDAIVNVLRREDLPEKIALDNVTKEVKNPFN